jgi:thioredoxin reductase
MHDYLILGAGPAGLQLAYFLERAGRDYLVLEAGSSPGTFFTRFPRHRRLLSINKVHTGTSDPEVNLRWDWNSLLSDDDRLRLRAYTGDYFPQAEVLHAYLGDFARRFDLRIRYGTRVVAVERAGCFTLRDEAGQRYQARRLVVASGMATPYRAPIPGIEHAESYAEVSTDPQRFAGLRVLIIGKGNSAFESANNLIPTAARIHLASPRPITMAWKTHFVGHLRATNNSFLDTYQLKSQNALLDAEVRGLERRDGAVWAHLAYSHAHGETEILAYDRVIACTGFRFDASIFDDSCRPHLTLHDRLPEQTSAWESTNVKDLYFAGTLTQARDYKRTTSAFIHGFRYNAGALHRILEHRYHGNEWPGRQLAAGAAGLRDAIIDRINRSSALWQQFGFLCDLIVVSPGGGSARCFEAVPCDYIADGAFGDGEHYLVTLDYGETKAADPFGVERIERRDVERAHLSQFLHPRVRHYRGRELVGEHHVIEDLAAEWREPEHLEPLHEFLRAQRGA